MVSLSAALTWGELFFSTAPAWLRTAGVLASAMAAIATVRVAGAQGAVSGQVSIIERPGARTTDLADAVVWLEPRSGGPNLSLIHISEPTRLLSISYAVFCL